MTEVFRVERRGDDAREAALRVGGADHHQHRPDAERGVEGRRKMQHPRIVGVPRDGEIRAVAEVLAEQFVAVGGQNLAAGVDDRQRAHAGHRLFQRLQVQAGVRRHGVALAPALQVGADAQQRMVAGQHLAAQIHFDRARLRGQALAFARRHVVAVEIQPVGRSAANQ